MLQTNKELINLIDVLLEENTAENEWLEFKLNYQSNENIGEYISALSNGAALKGRPFGYLIFGIDDISHEIKNTSYDYYAAKEGNEDLESWIIRLLEPKIPFTVYNIDYSAGHRLVMFEIPAAYVHPTSFKGRDYIRIGSYKKDLHKYPAIEKKLWDALNLVSYEATTSRNQNLHFTEAFMLAKKLGIEFTEEKFGTLHMLDADDRFNNLALLLSDENPHIVKFAVYQDDSLNFNVKEEFSGSWLLMLDQVFKYASLYNATSAVIDKDLARIEKQSYPDPSLREAIVNAFGHLDLSFPSDIKIEFYKDRVEISSPGSLYRTTMEEVMKGKQSFRNPNLIYVLSKFEYIENYATGIKRMYAAYKTCDEKPKFDVTDNFFTVILPNANYVQESTPNKEDDNNVKAQVLEHSVSKINIDLVLLSRLRDYLEEPRSRAELQQFCNISSRDYFRSNILTPLIEMGKIRLTIPEKPNSSKQKYIWNEDE